MKWYRAAVMLSALAVIAMFSPPAVANEPSPDLPTRPDPVEAGKAAAGAKSDKASPEVGNRVLAFARELAGPRPVRAKVRGDGGDAYRFSLAADGGIEVESGSARGVLYAVYDVLDGKASGDHKPAFSIRGLFECGVQQRYASAEMVRRFIDRMGRWRMNTLPVITAHGYYQWADIIKEECAKRGIDVIHYAYYQLDFCGGIPRKYFAVDDNGKPRPPFDHLETNDRLCASNPEGLDLYRQGVRKYLDAHPDHANLLYATPDGWDCCRCAQCSAMGTVGQAMPFFNAFVEATAGRGLHREFLVYFQRYRLPDDMTQIRNTDAIMFDDHTRNPMIPLQDPEMKAGPARAHSGVDDRAKGSTRNRYLFDRLKEWRAAYEGKIYIHENLMIHGALGVPRFNTSVYIEDLKQFQKLGVDGVVYEAYECGIRPFLPQLDVLAQALWEPDKAYEIHDDANPELHEFYRVVEAFKGRSDWRTTRELMRYLLARPDRDQFDWLWLGFQSMSTSYAGNRLPQLNAEERALLTRVKLWDYLEGDPNGREKVGRLIESIAAKLEKMP